MTMGETSNAMTLAPLLAASPAIKLHAFAAMTAFALAWRVTKSTLAAAFAALLFGLHPIQVESVAWISAINGPLFGALSLLSLERFLAWRERGSTGLPWASAVCLALALLAKELAFAVVPCALVLDLLIPQLWRSPGRSPISGNKPRTSRRTGFIMRKLLTERRIKTLPQQVFRRIENRQLFPG